MSTFGSTKKTMRQTMRARRRALSRVAQRRASHGLARRVGRLAVFCRARHIALYAAADGEIDLAPLQSMAIARGKRCYLPVLSAARRRRVYFAQVTAHSRYTRNYFGLAEPRIARHRWKTPQQLDLILMPLVAFDTSGNRIGMGGGFYDRSLAYLAHRCHWQRPQLIGVAHDCQRTARIASDAWDIALHGVVTDAAHYACEDTRRAADRC